MVLKLKIPSVRIVEKKLDAAILRATLFCVVPRDGLVGPSRVFAAMTDAKAGLKDAVVTAGAAVLSPTLEEASNLVMRA